MTNRTVLIAAALGAGLFLAGPASAAPFAAPSPDLAGGNANIVEVGRGCPFGYVPSYRGCVNPVRGTSPGYDAYGGGRQFGYGRPRPYGYGYRRPYRGY